MAQQHLEEDLVPTFVGQMLAQRDMNNGVLRCAAYWVNLVQLELGDAG
jgi:hypothetical protein